MDIEVLNPEIARDDIRFYWLDAVLAIFSVLVMLSGAVLFFL